MLEIFKNTYGSLHDSVIREFSYLYSSDQDSKNLTIKIDCRNILKDENWERIHLTFKKVEAFKFFEKINYTNQIINEVKNEIIDGFIVFDFYNNDNWTDLQSLEKSDFFVVSKDFSFEVEKSL